MDGKTLLKQLDRLLLEDASSAFMVDHLSYQFLNEAASYVAMRVGMPRASQSITTVADQEEYDVNADFLGLYLRDTSKNFYLVYSDGTSNHFITWKAYEDLILADQAANSVLIPSGFTLIDKSSLASRITGTASANGAASGGECTLTVATSTFSNVFAGDIVHNTTDGSTGVVVSKTSTTAMVTALFGGTNNDWSTSDAFVIQPRFRWQLIFDPPPSTAAHTATLHYIQEPGPVYSDYGMFRLPAQYAPAIVKMAAWLYRERDKDGGTADRWRAFADQQIRTAGTMQNAITDRKHIVFSRKRVG